MKELKFGQLLYGALFVVVLPVILVCWAWATRDAVRLPAIEFFWPGVALAALGTVLIIAANHALWVHGGGLPMNAYPPPRYVTRGIYRLLSDPIYVGFTMLCAGVSIAAGSSSGLWLITPVVALASAALTIGYEKPHLRKRFGDDVISRALISLPPATQSRPTGWERTSFYLLVLLPWAIAYEAVDQLGVPPDAVNAYLSFEHDWQVLEWTAGIYASTYVFVLLSPLVARTKRELRNLAVKGLLATGVVTFIFLTVPVVAPPRAFEPQTILGQLLMFERNILNEPAVAALPSFHVIWALIACEVFAARAGIWKLVGWTWVVLISVSCVTTGMHALMDIAAAVVVYVALRYAPAIWELIRRGGEIIANSWREWRWDGVRLINHGLYGGAAGALAIWITVGASGGEMLWPMALVFLFSLAGAALWAQRLEGSSKLSRPFGYYGGAIGAGVGCLVVGWATDSTMYLFALAGLALPWVQAVGRLRCLVQGCCHGYKSSEFVGIRYWRAQSRVVAMGELEGVPVHPTPVYSILGNIAIGIALIRIWSLGAPFGMIIGLYLILAGVARFVEESFRGEPQTPICWGMPIYQWAAITSFFLGVAFSSIPSGLTPALDWSMDVQLAAVGILFGVIATIAYGVDFPDSSRRYARLTPPLSK